MLDGEDPGFGQGRTSVSKRRSTAHADGIGTGVLPRRRRRGGAAHESINTDALNEALGIASSVLSGSTSWYLMEEGTGVNDENGGRGHRSPSRW